MSGLKPLSEIRREFLDIRLSPGNMPFYTVRTSIRDSVIVESRAFYGKVLDVGCGFMPYREIVTSVPAVESYTGLDLENAAYYQEAEPDLKWNGRTIPVADSSFDCVMATEFLEHYAEPEKVLAEILRVLKPKGRFFATVPFIWNLHELPHDEYRYTPASLERHAANAGFSEISVKKLGGWNMALAQMIGLWIGFAPMNVWLRRGLAVLAYPVYVLLVKTDRKTEAFDGRAGSMFNGLTLTARKPAE